MNLATTLDFNSPIHSFRLLDGYFNYFNVVGEQNMAIIVDVRSIEFVQGDGKIVESGWAVVPIFTQREHKLYVRSGYYQVPLIRGPPKSEIIKEMATYEDQWNYVQELINKRDLSYYEPFSVMVRLVDGQLEGHYQRIYDHTRFDYTYMPPETKNPNFLFTENSLVRLCLLFRKFVFACIF